MPGGVIRVGRPAPEAKHMLNPRTFSESLEPSMRRARRRGARILFSGAGFAAAYFFDPQLGPERRRSAAAAYRRARRAIAELRSPEENDDSGRDGEAPAPALPVDRERRLVSRRPASNGVGTPR